MDAVYIIAITISAIIFVLLIACFYVLATRRKEEERQHAELEAVYSDPKLAKMEYDIAFYDDDIVRPAAHTEADTQVTIDEVIAGAEVPAHTVEESAIFTKADDGMEEISGHYEPEEGADD